MTCKSVKKLTELHTFVHELDNLLALFIGEAGSVLTSHFAVLLRGHLACTDTVSYVQSLTAVGTKQQGCEM
jgi:hypothetical protein